MSFVLRLAVGSGRAATARLVLVALGTALASALLLIAAGLLTIERSETSVSGSAGTVTHSDGRTEVFDDPGATGALNSSYLVEPELRRGVAIGFVLCVVPLLVFVAMASRVAARRRDERLAGLRLAGATNVQVRLLAALDTAVGTATGALLGCALLVATREVVLRTTDGELRDLALVVAPPVWLGAVVLLALLAGLAGSAALALRAVRITPLGVARRTPGRRPRPWGLLVLVVALASFAGLASVGVPNTVGGDVALGVSLAAAMVGLIGCGPWLTAVTGRAAGRWARGPAVLLAGRRLEDEPRAQARAMSAVVLVVLSATIALVVLEEFRQVERGGPDPDYDAFAAQGFGLAALGMAFSLVVGAAGLLLTTVEGLLERRRTTAALVAGGVPVGVLRRAVLLQVALPVLPAASLAVAAGLAAVGVLFGADFPGVPPTIALLPVAAVAAALLAAAATLPALGRTSDPEQLRTP